MYRAGRFIRTAAEEVAALAALSGFIFMVLTWADYFARPL